MEKALAAGVTARQPDAQPLIQIGAVGQAALDRQPPRLAFLPVRLAAALQHGDDVIGHRRERNPPIRIARIDNGQIRSLGGGFHGMNDYALMSTWPTQPLEFPRPTYSLPLLSHTLVLL